MRDLSLHILDVVENSIRAGARCVETRLQTDEATGTLTLQIIDDGCGMDEAMCRQAASPFATSRTDRNVGLGLALLTQAARQAGGDCRVESIPNAGTRVLATFRIDHVDCKPVGDLARTFQTLLAGYPDVDFVLDVRCGDEEHHLDTRAPANGAARELETGKPSKEGAS